MALVIDDGDEVVIWCWLCCSQAGNMVKEEGCLTMLGWKVQFVLVAGSDCGGS